MGCGSSVPQEPEYFDAQLQRDFRPDVDAQYFLHSGQTPDQRGLIYFLGTENGKKQFQNPAETGFIKVGASSIAENCEPISCLVGRDLVRFATLNANNQWISFDFKKYKISPTGYCLRHYSSYDCEALRNWVFEGSSDGRNWSVIEGYMDDQSLQRKGQWHYFQLRTRPNDFYSCLRVRMTGHNSNDHHYLACSGFEVYGLVNFSGFELTQIPQMPTMDNKMTGSTSPEPSAPPQTVSDLPPAYSVNDLPPSGIFQAGSTGPTTKSIVDELKDLTDLKNQGALTEEQFENAKNVLLKKRSEG